MNLKKALATMVLILSISGVAEATPFSIMVGDNDGYGQGIADNGDGSWGSYTPQDWRSSQEQAATNGAQATDIYGVLYDSPPSSIDIIFQLSGNVTSATLTVDMADLQSVPIGISYNGLAQSPWAYMDGYRQTQVRSYVLDAATIDRINTDAEFVLTIATNAPIYDYIAFDYFQLQGQYDSAPVPEPSTFLLLGGGIACVMFTRKRMKKQLS